MRGAPFRTEPRFGAFRVFSPVKRRFDLGFPERSMRPGKLTLLTAAAGLVLLQEGEWS